MRDIAEKILSGCLTVAELLECEERLSKLHIIDERFSQPDCLNAKLTKCLLNLSRLVWEQHLKTHTDKPITSLESYDNLDSWLTHLNELIKQ